MTPGDATASTPEEDQAREAEWHMIDHPVEVALGHAYQWSSAVHVQAQRVIHGSGLQKIPDAYLLVLALRNVVRAAEMAARHLAGQPRDELLKAIRAVKSAGVVCDGCRVIFLSC